MKNSPAKKPKSSINPGGMFALGRHRLICGDARDRRIVETLCGDDKIKAILCDPPYGVAYVEGKAGFRQKLGCGKIIANDQEQTEAEYREFSRGWLETAVPHLDKKNTAYIFNSDKMAFALREAMIAAGYKFAQLLVWVKSHAVVGRMDYIPQHELIAYGWHGTHEFMKSKDKSVLFYPKPNKSKLHPTMKPVALLRNLILNSTKIGDVVYDPFGGSGSTLMAAEQTRRKCLMVELDPEYCQTIIDRYEKLTGAKAEKIT